MRSPADVISIGILILLCSAATACRDGKRSDDPDASSASSPSSSVAAPSPPASSPAAASADDLKDASASAEAELDLDAGTDGGKRKLRRLGSAGDASAPETSPAVVAPSPAASVDSRAGKRGVKPMGDELPYGGTGASAAPVLDKKPLVKEDPWGKPAPP